MKRATRLAELESMGRPLTPDECREANALRVIARKNRGERRRYRDDPAFRQKKLVYSRGYRRTLEAAE